MKKLAIILAMAMVLAPLSAFALDTITDADMNNVTGQAGVSILLDSLQIVQSAQVTAYGDDDGSNVNWLTMVQDNSVTTDIGFHGDDPIMIDLKDMATLQAVLAGAGSTINNIGAVGVQITLNDQIEIITTGQQDTIYLTQTAPGATQNAADELIKRFTSGGTTDLIFNVNGALTTMTSGAVPVNTAIIITNH